jgi:monovalent cation/hydrogen antiporter
VPQGDIETGPGMLTTIILLVVTLLVISAAACLAPKLKIPAPLFLVVAGIGAGFVSFIPNVTIDPHIITLGLLPPLLYASATSIPAMNFRREFRAINGLSGVLVLASSLVLGGMFVWLIPDLSFGWGVALGAILSPTDAVATSIIKGRGVPGRVTVMLEGESLLNDATALIVLRTAIVATSLGFAVWPTLLDFALAIGVAVLVGILAAHANLTIRKRVHEEAVNTLLSFTTPFVAAVPAELLHGSGLVAAVIAGFVIGARAPRVLPPGHRVSDMQNWATVQLGLEGIVFLTMGLQLPAIVTQLATEPVGVGLGLGIAPLALGVTLAVRGLYVTSLLKTLRWQTQRQQARQPEIAAFQAELEAGRIPDELMRRVGRRKKWITGDTLLQRLASRGRRHLADLDYLARQPLGYAETAIIVWAGMRGAVTVAAAQLLPEETPHRPLLVFIAFAVASLSLVLQGGTIGLLVARLFPNHESDDVVRTREAERAQIEILIVEAGTDTPRPDAMPYKTYRLAVLAAQRNALLDARDDGIFGAEALELALRDVDIDELVLEMRTGAAATE